MKLKTKVRAGKIRPNHNVTLHRTVAFSFVTGRIAAQAAETAEVAIFATSTRERLQLCVRPPTAGAASQGARFWSEIIATPGGKLHAAAARK
jgi:hypothetical protein